VTRYQVFLFFHIASVILWVGAGTTLGLLWLHPDSALRARIGALGEWLGPRLFAPAALGALVFGLLLVHEGHWTYSPLWVQLGLGAFGASFVINAAIRPRLARALPALALFEVVLLYATVADMALKPTSSDTSFLITAGVVLALLAANVVFRAKSVPAGTTEA
jgi:hypothetical protein